LVPDRKRAEDAADYLSHENYYNQRIITGWMQKHKLCRIKSNHLTQNKVYISQAIPKELKMSTYDSLLERYMHL
jgi:hypothetical protein